ncbi:MAG: hypothetical protein ACRDG3_06215 [Tepidiformaceae bacterium]
MPESCIGKAGAISTTPPYAKEDRSPNAHVRAWNVDQRRYESAVRAFLGRIE